MTSNQALKFAINVLGLSPNAFARVTSVRRNDCDRATVQRFGVACRQWQIGDNGVVLGHGDCWKIALMAASIKLGKPLNYHEIR